MTEEITNPNLTFTAIVTEIVRHARHTRSLGIATYPFAHPDENARQTENLIIAARHMFDFEAEEFLRLNPGGIAVNPLHNNQYGNRSHMINRLHDAITEANRRRTYT